MRARSIVAKTNADDLHRDYEMFNIERTHHVLAVNDIETSERYFIDKLGFELRSRVDGWSFLSLLDFHVMMGHCKGELPARDTNNHSWFAYVNCDGIDELFADYKKRGVEFTQEISDKPWGLREFGVTTPEGHRIVFGQRI